MQLEKRSNLRLDFGILVHHNHKRRMTMDISKQGCFIRKDEQVKDMVLEPVGKEISFSLDIPTADDYIDVTGTVVHHGKDEVGIGIWFKRIDERDKEFIRKYLSDYLQEVFFHEPTS